MTYVSPAVYALAVIVPEPRNVPAAAAVHSVQWVASCEPAIPDQVMSASFDIAPDDAAPNETSLRVVSVATAVVPAAPGSAVCNWMYGVATENDVLLPTASSHELQRDVDGPVATGFS
jgi:hypothetical protein